jgi:LPXTG-motif cell wall-anchored protein
VATYDRDGGKDGKYSDKYLKIDDEYTHADFGYYCPIKATYTSTTLKQVSPKTGTETSMASGISALIAALVAFVVYKRQIFVAKK